MFISFASNSTYITRPVKSLWHQSNRSFSFPSLQIEHNFIVIEHQEISLLKAKRLILRRTQARTQRHGQPAIRRTIPKNEVRPHPVRICLVRVRGRPSASADRSKYFVFKNFQVPSRGFMTESTWKIKEQRAQREFCSYFPFIENVRRVRNGTTCKKTTRSSRAFSSRDPIRQRRFL